MMKGSEIVGFGSFNIPKNFDKIIADNRDLAECTSRIDCEIILSICGMICQSHGQRSVGPRNDGNVPANLYLW